MGSTFTAELCQSHEGKQHCVVHCSSFSCYSRKCTRRRRSIRYCSYSTRYQIAVWIEIWRLIWKIWYTFYDVRTLNVWQVWWHVRKIRRIRLHEQNVTVSILCISRILSTTPVLSLHVNQLL